MNHFQRANESGTLPPILTLEGIEGKLFRPMALTVIFAVLIHFIQPKRRWRPKPPQV